MTTSAITESRSPLKFFLLVFVLSIPLYLIGAVTSGQILPGLPVSALMFIAPLLAALVLVYSESKITGVTALIKRSFDFRRIRTMLWYAPIFLLIPGVMVLSYGVMRLVGRPVPLPQFSLPTVLTLSLMFFIAGLCEELGWMGYAFAPMQERSNALLASILLGLVWAVWHFIPLAQADRSPSWIAWWSLNTVALRILIVWIYNNAGESVFAAAVVHATINLGWQLFPVNGSYYDPSITGLITTFLAVIVALIWGSRTLTRSRINSKSLRITGA